MATSKSQKYKHRYTNIKHNIKDRVARTPHKIEGELKYSGRVAVPALLAASYVLL